MRRLVCCKIENLLLHKERNLFRASVAIECGKRLESIDAILLLVVVVDFRYTIRVKKQQIVGQNLHDHFSTDIVWELNGPHSYDKYKKLHWKLWAGTEYLLFRSGPVSSNIVEGGAFWWSDRSAETPDLQFHFLAGAAAFSTPAPARK